MDEISKGFYCVNMMVINAEIEGKCIAMESKFKLNLQPVLPRVLVFIRRGMPSGEEDT